MYLDYTSFNDTQRFSCCNVIGESLSEFKQNTNVWVLVICFVRTTTRRDAYEVKIIAKSNGMNLTHYTFVL